MESTMDDTNAKREARKRRILENSENRLRMITSRHNQDETKDMMNETNTRREARKRKILENSENRLHKIDARCDLDETKADDKSFVENNSLKSSLEECAIRNGTCNFENNINLHHYTGFNEDEYERFNTRFNENNYDGHDERGLSNINERDTYTCPSEETFDKKFMLCTYLSYRLNLIMLAAIVNILSILKLDDWFGKTILVPYLLLMMMGRWHNFEKLREAKGSSFISAITTMIFTKIKPNVIYKLEALFILCDIILNDFCLYMFSFVLMHYFHTICSYCYHVLMQA